MRTDVKLREEKYENWWELFHWKWTTLIEISVTVIWLTVRSLCVRPFSEWLASIAYTFYLEY